MTWMVRLATNCERSRAKRGELAELASLRKARELLFNVLGFEQAISRKICILGIWSIDVISSDGTDFDFYESADSDLGFKIRGFGFWISKSADSDLDKTLTR